MSTPTIFYNGTIIKFNQSEVFMFFLCNTHLFDHFTIKYDDYHPTLLKELIVVKKDTIRWAL